MAMTNMKMSATERKEYMGETVASEGPEYPYGLCLRLDDDALEKLGLTELPAVGTEVMVMAKAVVKSTSAYARNGGENHRDVELQVTDMELGPVASASSAADALYGA
jgi:hypothetical protein